MAYPSQFVSLAEDDLLLRPAHRPLGAHPTLQGTAKAVFELGMTAPQPLEQGDRTRPWCRFR
ncbi:hypothetical protein DU505_09640 [Billgrantia montanilacus]|uniref:Uncharacterized protein n=1 Tax=Billgrantia montanilacus TaxID=2282305 RepID=A0A368U010_9GAMM|nr:hypothetical protein DU505_09640 [Halomonas montanilacus]